MVAGPDDPVKVVPSAVVQVQACLPILRPSASGSASGSVSGDAAWHRESTQVVEVGQEEQAVPCGEYFKGDEIDKLFVKKR